MKKILKGLFFVVILLILGEVVPRMALSYGQENSERNGKIFALYSTEKAQQMVAYELDKKIITGMRMTKYVEKPGKPGDPICMDYPIVLRGEYQAEITFYTVFGVPYAKVSVNCQGASIKRNI
jgi:hypothetical protein